jgi:two-component system, LytTR family, response regulator
VGPQSPDKVLEGFCPEPRSEERIAVIADGLMLFLRLTDIEWLEETDNCVVVHVGKETHVLRDTLAAVAAKMPTGRFRRIARGTLVNVEQIKELQPMRYGRCGVLLRSGTRLTFMRSGTR